MIGAMDQKITLQRIVQTPDGAGGQTDAWVNYSVNPQVWAQVVARSGREAITEGRVVASYVVTFKIWNRSDVGDRDRILWNGVSYNIRGIRHESGSALVLSIDAERGVAS